MIKKFQQLAKRCKQIDQKYTLKILQTEDPFLSKYFYFFASLFHSKLLLLVFLSVLLTSKGQIHMTLTYMFLSGLSGIATFYMKNYFCRLRPKLPKNYNLSSKSAKFRLKEQNYAMPSGDSFQSGTYVAAMLSLGVPWIFGIWFQISVCVSRVYYNCHWIGDTIVGTIGGLLMYLLFPIARPFIGFLADLLFIPAVFPF